MRKELYRFRNWILDAGALYVDTPISLAPMVARGVSIMKQITREVLKNMMDTGEDYVLMDARGHQGYDEEHLPGAISIPADHMAEGILRDYAKDRTMVTYCSSFACESSTIAAKKLEKFGYTKVLEFKGGLKDWNDAGYRTEKAAPSAPRKASPSA